MRPHRHKNKYLNEKDITGLVRTAKWLDPSKIAKLWLRNLSLTLLSFTVVIRYPLFHYYCRLLSMYNREITSLFTSSLHSLYKQTNDDLNGYLYTIANWANIYRSTKWVKIEEWLTDTATLGVLEWSRH